MLCYAIPYYAMLYHAIIYAGLYTLYYMLCAVCSMLYTMTTATTTTNTTHHHTIRYYTYNCSRSADMTQRCPRAYGGKMSPIIVYSLCYTLQYITLLCNMLCHDTLRYITSQYVVLCYNTLCYITLH